MGDKNPIRTLRDYSKPSHDGYRNTIELPVGNNVVPLRSDTIRLVQNGCSFHRLRSENPNQHLKDFLKLVDSLDLDGENRERTRMRLFQFSLRDQASNWLEYLPAGSITTWEDLTTHFLAQFFPPGRTAKLHNDILMFQQHHGESLSKAWTRLKDLLQKVPHHGIDLWLQLRDRNVKESCALLEELSLYVNESWNDPRDFAKPIKAITLPQDVLSTSDRRLIELENQVQRLMEAHLAPTQPTQMNRFTTPCEIGSKKRLSSLKTQLEQQQDDMNSKINLLWNTISEKLDDAPLCDTENEAEEEGSVEPNKTNYTNRKNANETDKEVESEKEVEEETEGETEDEEEDNPEHFDTFPTMKVLRYHELEPRRKPSNPKKNRNFVRRVKGQRVFIGNFSYECDFMVLEDTTSVIDYYLGSVVFGKSFVEATGLVYNKEEGMVMFERDKERIIFKMPQKIDMFKHVDFMDRGTDSIPPFIIESHGDNCEKTYYSDSLDLGPKYKYDEYVSIGIRSLMAAKSRRKNKGELT
ncbi:MAK10-like protein [Tanacetum coccineum]